MVFCFCFLFSDRSIKSRSDRLPEPCKKDPTCRLTRVSPNKKGRAAIALGSRWRQKSKPAPKQEGGGSCLKPERPFFWPTCCIRKSSLSDYVPLVDPHTCICEVVLSTPIYVSVPANISRPCIYIYMYIYIYIYACIAKSSNKQPSLNGVRFLRVLTDKPKEHRCAIGGQP